MLKKPFYAAAAGLAAAAVMVSAQAQEITGAGASFPAPLYSKWAADYQKATNVRLNYQSIGSSGGVRCSFVSCRPGQKRHDSIPGGHWWRGTDLQFARHSTGSSQTDRHCAGRHFPDKNQ